MAHRDLLILLAHRVFADADVRHDEVDVCEGFLRVRRVRERDFWRALGEQDLAGLSNLRLALRIVIVELDLADREAVLMVEQHEDDARRKGAAAAGDDDG